MEGGLYDGLPVDQLPIDAVDVPDEAHLRRSGRYSGAVDIEPEHAVEAVFDPRRLVATAWPADSRIRRVYGGKENKDG